MAHRLVGHLQARTSFEGLWLVPYSQKKTAEVPNSSALCLLLLIPSPDRAHEL